jgi:hypothetical protein
MSWRAIACAASRLVFSTVSSTVALAGRTLPVLTVDGGHRLGFWSITSVPPDFSSTRRASASRFPARAVDVEMRALARVVLQLAAQDAGT